MYYHGPAPRQEGRRRGRPRIGECVGFVEHPLGLTQKDVERVRKGIKPSARKGKGKGNEKNKDVSVRGSRSADTDDEDRDDEYRWGHNAAFRKSNRRDPMSKSSPVRAVAERRRTMKMKEELKRRRRNSLPAVIPATDSSQSSLSTGPPRKVARLEENIYQGSELGGLSAVGVVPDSAGEEEEEEEFMVASQPSTGDEIRVRSFSKSPLPAPSPSLWTTQHSTLGNLPSSTYMTALRSPDHQTRSSDRLAGTTSSEEEADSSVEVHESMTLPGRSKPNAVDNDEDDGDMEDSIVVRDTFSYPNTSERAASDNFMSSQTVSSQRKITKSQGRRSSSKLSQSSITASWRGLKSSKATLSSFTKEKESGDRGSISGTKSLSSSHSAISRHHAALQKPSSIPMSSTTTLRDITQVPQLSQRQEAATGEKATISGTIHASNSINSTRRNGSAEVNEDNEEDAPPASQQTPLYHRPTQHVFTIGESSSEDEAGAAVSQFSSTLC